MNRLPGAIDPFPADPILGHQYLPVQVGACQYTGMDKLEPANARDCQIKSRRPPNASDPGYERRAAPQLDLVVSCIAAEHQLPLKPFQFFFADLAEHPLKTPNSKALLPALARTQKTRLYASFPRSVARHSPKAGRVNLTRFQLGTWPDNRTRSRTWESGGKSPKGVAS